MGKKGPDYILPRFEYGRVSRVLVRCCLEETGPFRLLIFFSYSCTFEIVSSRFFFWPIVVDYSSFGAFGGIFFYI